MKAMGRVTSGTGQQGVVQYTHTATKGAYAGQLVAGVCWANGTKAEWPLNLLKRTCGACGGLYPLDRSCDCFDNHCQ